MNGCYNMVANNSNDSISYIQVNNKGLFMANFEVTYEFQGQIYSNQSFEFADGINKRMIIPNGATKVYLRIEIATFIGVWSTVYVNVFDSITQKCFEVDGTTYSATCKEIDCPPDGGNGGCGNCCCCCCNCSCMGNTDPCMNSCGNGYVDSCTTTSMNSCGNAYGDPYTTTSMNSCGNSYGDPYTTTYMNSCGNGYVDPCMNSCDMSCNGMMNNYMC